MNNQQNTYDDNAFPKGFTFNGVSSKQLGFVVQTPPKYEMPEKDYTITHVPGRHGDIVIDNGSYKNVKRTYAIATVYSQEGTGLFNPEVPTNNFVDKAEQLYAWLMSAKGYAALSDGYESQYVREAMFLGGKEIEDFIGKAIMFEVEFDCKPQRYFKDYYNLNRYFIEVNTKFTIPKPTLNNFINKNIGNGMIIEIPHGIVYGQQNVVLELYKNNVLVNTLTLDIPGLITKFGSVPDVIIDTYLEECYFIENDETHYVNEYVNFTNGIFKIDYDNTYALKRTDYTPADEYTLYMAFRWYRI